ncbi:hypothetical protein AGMMS4957_01430 [Bacteroidia bacterium]|nr:hypothetical protein AGMMS4957_01430 [Bacteroidia bacterium]
MKKLVLFAALVAVVSFASCKKAQNTETGVIEPVVEEVTTEVAPEEISEGETVEGEAAPAETPVQ